MLWAEVCASHSQRSKPFPVFARIAGIADLSINFFTEDQVKYVNSVAIKHAAEMVHRELAKVFSNFQGPNVSVKVKQPPP